MRNHETEIDRIHKLLCRYLSPKEARRATSRIHLLVMEVDQEIDRILKDPLVLEFYDYDGKFFTPKGGFGFNVVFNGASVLEWITRANLNCFRRWKENTLNVDWLMENLSTHIWAAKVRRMNWEEEGHLMCLSGEVIDAILRQSTEYRRQAAALTPELTPGEKDFFRSYEADVATIPSAPEER